MVELINDKYRKARGGKAFLIRLFCASCGTEVLLYQKDGDGMLKRCYLNRIRGPSSLESLQHSASIRQPEDLPNLACPSCSVVIGSPVRHYDGRLAFRLRQGFFTKKRIRKGGLS